MNYDSNNIFYKKFADLEANIYKTDLSLKGFRCLFIYVTDINVEKDYPIAFGYFSSLIRMNHGEASLKIIKKDNLNIETFEGYDVFCFFPLVELFYEILAVSERLKSNFPDSKIIFANSEQHQHQMILSSPKAVDYFSLVMKKHLHIDFSLIGESEFSFIKLCEKICFSKKNYYKIPGVLFRDNNGDVLFSDKKIKPVDYNFLPYPSRDFLTEYFESKKENLLPIRIQMRRGCTMNCKYCAESFINITDSGRTTAVLMRPLDDFIYEIELLYNKFNIRFFNIIDSSFEDPGKKGIGILSDFCDMIIYLNIHASFKIHLRLHTLIKLSEELILKLKKAGVDIIVTGLESSIERELLSYTTKQVNFQKFKAVKEKYKNFFIVTGYMMFSAKLRLEDIKLKIRQIYSLGLGWDYLVLSNTLLCFRGTAYHDFLKNNNLTDDKDPYFPLVSYRYEDERLNFIIDELKAMKNICPEIMSLNKLLYDAGNILARFSNAMNKHLWGEKEAVIKFSQSVSAVKEKLQETYIPYIRNLIELTLAGWNKSAVEKLNQKTAKSVSEYYLIMNSTIEIFLNSLEEKGLSTSRLYLKTWLSTINIKNIKELDKKN